MTFSFQGTVIVCRPAFFPLISPDGQFWYKANTLFSRPNVVKDVVPLDIPGLVQWRQNIETLNTMINTITGPKLVVGHSEGAQFAEGWLSKYGNACTVPASQLSFLLSGNPDRKYGGVLRHQSKQLVLNGIIANLQIYDTIGHPNNTPYSVIDVARQYEPHCDVFTDDNNAQSYNQWQSAANMHLDYSMVDLNSSSMVKYQDPDSPNSQYWWWPTYPLPSIQNILHLASWVRNLDKQYRTGVDAGYTRGKTGEVHLPVPTYT